MNTLLIILIVLLVFLAIFYCKREFFSQTRSGKQTTYKPFRPPASKTMLRSQTKRPDRTSNMKRTTRKQRATQRPRNSARAKTSTVSRARTQRVVERFKNSKTRFSKVSRKEKFSSRDMVFKAPPSLTMLKSEGRKTEFGEATTDEVYGKEKSLTEIFEILDKVDRQKTFYMGNALSYPSFFHAEEKWPGCLPRPLYQGTCGSCWGFATVTALSSRFYLESCGISGCNNYPQINFGSLNNVYNNINETYKFRKLFLTDVFKYIDTNRNRFITRDEWIDVIMNYYELFNNLGTPMMEKHYIVQVLTYILDFQSLGSVDLRNIELVLNRADEVFDVWKTFTAARVIDSAEVIQAAKEATTIDLDALEDRWKSEPIGLSAEKIVACCIRCIEVDFEDKRNKDAPQALLCLGGTLDDGWSLLRETGTPTALCIGYNMDSYEEGDITPSCKIVQGPYYSFCSGYSMLHEDTDLDQVLDEYENSWINPLAIPHNEKNLPWIDPQLFRFRAKNVYQIQNNMKSIQREIIERGPVTTGFYIYPDFQYDFGSDGLGGQNFIPGTNPLGSTKDSLIYMWSGEGDPMGGHAVTVVGWGTYIYETDQVGCVCKGDGVEELLRQMKNKKTVDPSTIGQLQCDCTNDRGMREVKIPYWICLNSWGVNWGTSGFASIDDRTKEPTDLTMGGYFWMVRGINNCEIEDNFVAGQPDLENISYPGIVEQYGWGLPPPDKDEVRFVKQIDHVNTGPNNEFIFERSKEGGGTFVDRTKAIVDTPEGTEDLNEWRIQSMTPPSPYVLFWNDIRPIYCLGLTNEEMDSLTNDDVIVVDPIVIKTLGLIENIQMNPLLVVNEEQMQVLYTFSPEDNPENTFSGIKVYRGVNNSNITKHPANSIIKVVPFKNLSPDALEQIIDACPLEEIQYIDVIGTDESTPLIVE